MILLWLVVSADPDPSRLFTHEAEVHVAKPGLQRLLLGEQILQTCDPTLADVRLYGDGEVPFIVHSQRALVLEKAEIVQPELRGVKHEAGRETFELVFPSPISGAWSLIFDSARTDFARQVAVVDPQSGQRTQASIYRLPAMGRERVKVSLQLSNAKRLVVELDSEETNYLDPRVRLERDSRVSWPNGELSLPLEMTHSHSGGQHTTVELKRPRGVVPTQLMLTADGVYDRVVKVWDVNAAGEHLLAEGRIFRLERGVEEPMLRLRPARGDRLRVEIEDKDSPPLQSLSLVAKVEQPALVFLTRDTRPLVLRFGGGRMTAPDYDIAALVSPGYFAGKRGEAAERLFAVEQMAPAELGPIRPNERFDRTPFLQFAMRAGAPVDARAYEWRAPLSVQPARAFEGLSRITPSVDDVARARDDLADLRIVDQKARQWPYILLPDAARAELTAQMDMVTDGRATTYTFSFERARISQLTLDTREPFFDRDYTLEAADADGKQVLARGRLTRHANARASPVLSFAPLRTKRLLLTVQNGSDAPLAIERGSLTARLPLLYLAAPAGDYFLLAGNNADTRPAYELERIRDLVLSVPADEALLRAGATNPDYSSMSKLQSGPGPMQLALWAAIVLAVIALAAMTLRLARDSS